MDLLTGLKTIPKLIKQVFAGQAVRNDIIGNANQLATAILTASGFTASRLNAALIANENDRLQILSQLTANEIESFSRMNGHCALIYSSSNALSRWWTQEAANVNMSGRTEAQEVFRILENAEQGMQILFNELLSAPTSLTNLSDAEMKKWIQDAIGKTTELTTVANECVRDLSRLI